MRTRTHITAGLLAGLVAIVTPALGASAALEREFRYDRSRASLTSVGGRTEVTFAGALRDPAPGRPDLPRLSERVPLPDGQWVVGVEVIALETEPLADAVRLPSTLVTRPGLEAPERTPEDPVAFSRAGFQPDPVVTLGNQGLQRGRGIAALEVAPVRWDAATGRLERVVRVRVRLTLGPAAWPDPAPRERVVPEWEDAGATPPRGALISSMAPASERAAQPFAATQLPSLHGSPVEYVIITNEEMQGEFQRLADWKTRSGVPAVVRTMSFIRQEYPQGSDDAERVRYFIRDAYSRWGTKWVLLGGDTEVLPTRLARTVFYGGEYIACDMYYSCLDGNWNADGDSLYGEGYFSLSNTGDAVDLFPEVYVGRAPTTTAAQAAQFVDKSIQYVTAPDLSGYLSRVLFFAEVLFPQNWSPGMGTTLDGAELVEEVLPHTDAAPNIATVRLYENHLDARWRPGAYLETRSAVIDSLNRGYNVAVHVGHGYRNVMSVGDNNLTNADAMSLTNGSKLVNLYAINCTSNAIDFPSIGEAFLHAPSGGAVTCIGSTRFDFPTAGRAFQAEWFRLLFEDSVTAIGELQSLQKIPFIGSSTYDGVYRWTEMTLLLLGDPELRVYLGEPRVLAVVHPPSLALGDSLVTVNVATGGQPLQGARVTLYRPGKDLRSALTDGAGNATLVFRPDTVGTAMITVTALNATPYRTDVPVVAVGQASLAGLAIQLDDDSIDGTSGNGDDRLDAGETVDLLLPIRNNGGATTGVVVGTLSTSDPDATLILPNQVYGVVAPNATATPSGGFRVAIPYSVEDQREIAFRVDLTDTGGDRHVESFTLAVHAPELRHVGHGVADAGGNGDGRPDPGETVTYTPRLRNLGTGGAPGATGILRSLDGLSTVTDSTTTWGGLASGEEKVGDGVVFVPSSPDAKLELRVSDAYGLLFTQRLDLTIPPNPISLQASGAATDVALRWARVGASDLLGYHVYRSTQAGGPYARITAVPTERSTYFLDSGLAPLTPYYYTVTAVDSSSNESAPSAEASASTSPPLHTIFPVPMGRNTPSSVAIDHVYPGFPVAIAAGAEVLYVWNPDGSAPIDADGQGTTLGDFTTRGRYYAGGPSIADIDADGIPEFIGTTWDSTRLYVFDRDGAVKPGFPLPTGDSFSGTAVGDVDGDGKKEMVFATNSNRFYAVRWNGTELLDGDANPGTLGVFKVLGGLNHYGTPALADLDGDGKQDILFGGADGLLNAWRWNGTSLPGFPIALGGSITGSVAVGYLDGPGDTQLDIVVPAFDESLYAFTAVGARRGGWPVPARNSSWSKSPSPALADMNRDGFLDVVQATLDGLILVFDRNGVPLAPFVGGARYTALTEFASESSPVVADIDGDGWNDIVMGGEDAKINAISGATGLPLAGFPIALGGEARGTPAVCDCDGDGMTEILLSCWDTNLYIWDYDFPFSPGQAPAWPQFHHDAARTGLYSNPVFVGVEEPTPPDAAGARLAFAPPRPNPARAVTRLWYSVPAEAGGASLEIGVYDLSGRRVRVLEQGPARVGPSSVAWDLRDDGGARVRDGVYFARLSLDGATLVRKVVVLD
jgi:hypothetical protein